MFFTFRVLKDLQDWKEAPLDSLVLSLYQLQAFYLNETKRGLAGLGNYNVAQKYHAVCLDQIAVQYLPTNSPEEIVKRIKEGSRTQWWNTASEGEEGKWRPAASGETDENSDCSCSSTVSTPEWQHQLRHKAACFQCQGNLRSYKSSNLVPATILQLPIHRRVLPHTSYQADYGYVGVYQASKKEPDPTPEEHKEQKRQEKWQEKATTTGCGAWKSWWDACKQILIGQISLALCSFTDGNVFDSGAEALDLLWKCLNETDELSGKKRPCVLLTVICV